jgi:thiamine-monophosphate kinase
LDDRALLRQVMEIVGRECCLDDCAVLPYRGAFLVATTDMLHEETDFPKGMSDWQMGWMSAAVTLSDIASMGAAPLLLLLAIGLDSEDHLRGILEGARACCGTFGAELAGGDLDHHQELTIVSSGLGEVTGKNRLVRRSGAVPGDRICLTGIPGRAQAALAGYDQHRKALVEPVPRVREGQSIGRAGAHAMMDTSDGLSLSLYDLLEANNCGFAIESDLIPRPEGVSPDEALDFALFGGGDYDLIFAIPPDSLPVPGVPASEIGTVTAERTVLLDGRPLPKRGFQHIWEEG